MMNVTIDDLENAVRAAEAAVLRLQRHFESPCFVQIHGSWYFRHAKCNDLLMSYLKCVRSVSSLNACLVLLHHGFVQEIGILCRCVDDNYQDVAFLATALGEGGNPSKDQIRLVEEFFQEEFDRAEPLSSTQKRDRVKRSKVHAAIARLPGQPTDPYSAQKASGCLHQAFSGYVHGAYVHIMELYGGTSETNLTYHMHGLQGTPRINEWTGALSSYVYRTLIAIEIVATRCKDVYMQQELALQRQQFETATGIGSVTGQ